LPSIAEAYVRWSRVLGAAAAALVVASPGTAQAEPVSTYYAPPFAGDCTWHRFGEGEAPDPTGYPDDPLCVEYAKRDITVDNGGALAFALAEPARVALAAPVCQYWQRDHWSVQFSRGDVPVVRWDGSYWFDKGTGQAAGRLRNLTLGGEPVSAEDAARAVEGASPELAAFLRAYGGDRGLGAGADAGVPLDPRCLR
jgi:hypothetical protein